MNMLHKCTSTTGADTRFQKRGCPGRGLPKKCGVYAHMQIK